MAVEIASTTMADMFAEQFAKVWIELVLAIIAAIVYINISRTQTVSANQEAEPSSFVNDKVSVSRTPKEMTEKEQDLTASQKALKALRTGQIAEAIALVHGTPDCIRRVPFDVACRFLTTVANNDKLSSMTTELRSFKGKVSPQALEAAIVHTMKTKDAGACRQLQKLSALMSIPKSETSFEALAAAYGYDDNAHALRVLVEEVPVPLPTPFAKAALEACTRLHESQLAAEIIEKSSSADGALLAEVANDAKLTANNQIDQQATESLEVSLAAMAKAKQERDAMTTSSKEVAMRANDIRSCGKNGDLKGAIKVFERLGDQGHTALILNSLLDACVECKDMQKAIEYFTSEEFHSVADVISYNTMMKGYLATGQETSAKKLLTQLSQKGLTATRTSFHGLLNARVNAGDSNGAWKLVTEMQANGISPNAVTCSILMKSKVNSASDVSRILALIDNMDQPMDEVLFPSVVDACIRTKRLDMLSRQTEKFLKQGSAALLTAPTYGSMIKAYGIAHDLKRVWSLWEQMIAHGVQPSPVTLGCMVEALVANGRADEAWQLTQNMWSSATTRPLVNTVIYASILKGFSQAKETEKVIALYEEMRANKIQANTITYNTILNAFAQGGAMYRVATLLEDMKAACPPIEPDIVTYSTIVKGFCNTGNLDRALKVLDDMKSIGKHAPDEVMYNSLLGGCAKEHRADDALALLNDMKKYNVVPSNYTLSMLVKLMGRCRRIHQAFTMLEDISKEYGLKINIQVYTCLIQGCFNAGQATKALSVFEKILEEGLQPDAMTYSVLVRGCVQGGLLDKAAEITRSAYGNGQKGTQPGLNAGCFDELVTALGESSPEGKQLQAEFGHFQAAPAWTASVKGNGKGHGKGGVQYSRQRQWN